MSLARATDDPSLKKRYETLALDFLERDDADSQRTMRTAVIAKSGPNRGGYE